MSDSAAVILGAGRGTRMRSNLPKVLHPIAGLPMIRHVLAAAAPLRLGRTVVVGAADAPELAAAVAPAVVATQTAQRGTADALRTALPLLGDAKILLVLYGDAPLTRTETLHRLATAVRAGAAAAVLGFETATPDGYGRLVTAAETPERLEAIVEHRDANAAQRRLTLCNGGLMALDAARAIPLLARIENRNASGEFYLTDLIALARAAGAPCVVVRAPEEEALGVNDRAALATAEALWQQRRRRAAMLEDGATLIAPETVFFSWDTRIGQDVVIGPHVVFGPGVALAGGAIIHAFSHLEGAAVAAGATVGPFARLRPGTRIERGARVGNFVELKQTVLEEGAKANHLAYLGDATIGAGANIGAGVITCNYDGVDKHRTTIGAGAFIGSNSALVAPLTVGRGALIGAGSVIVRDVADDALAVARGTQQHLPLGARQFRDGRRKPAPPRQE